MATLHIPSAGVSFALAAAACLGAFAQSEPAAPAPAGRVVDIEMVRMDGTWVAGRLQRIDERTITVLATVGGSGEVEVDRASVALAAFRDRSERQRRLQRGSSGQRLSDVTGVLELADGQSLPGTHRIDSGTLVWDHRWLGPLPVAIDRSARLRLTGTRPVERSNSTDRILLINGDRLEGFIESIAEDVVLGSATSTGKPDEAGEEPQNQAKDSGQEPRRIGLDRIACIAFADASAATPVSEDSVRIRATDGTVLLGSDVRFDTSSGWRYLPADPAMPAIREEIAFASGLADPTSIWFSTSRIRDIASIAPSRVAVPDGEYRYEVSGAIRREISSSDPTGLGSFSIDAPAVVDWIVPRELLTSGATVIATIDVASESDLRDSGAVEIEFRAGASATTSIRLGGGTSRATLRIEFDPAAADTLSLTLRDGGDGPVGDRIRCSRGLLISSPSPSPSR